MFAVLLKPHFTIFFFALSLFVAVLLFLYRSPSLIPQISVSPHSSIANLDIWSVPRVIEWRPCKWWQQGNLSTLPARSNGYIRVDCYGGLNQMRRDLCDGVGIARLLNATLVLPKFEVAAYWNDSSGFADVFDADYFILQLNTFIEVIKELPTVLRSIEPFHVDCSKRKGHFDYIESVLPSLLQHRYISFTPSMSQRRDRYPVHAKASLCKACYSALKLTPKLENKASELLRAIPRPFLSLHLRFEPDMVAYSQCEYPGLSPASISAVENARSSHQRSPFSGEAGRLWRKRGKCPLTPKETAFILTSLAIPSNTTIYLAAGDGVMESEGLKSVYKNVLTKDDLGVRSGDVNSMAALDYYVSIHSDAYVGTYFGNMDKMVAAMRVMGGLYKTVFLNRRAFAEFEGRDALWRAHVEDFRMGRGYALPEYCFCEFKL